MSSIMFSNERRDALTELVRRLDEWKVTHALQRTQGGLRWVCRKPFHALPIRIALSDDEQCREVEACNVFAQIVIRQLTSERRWVGVGLELQRLEQRPMFV